MVEIPLQITNDCLVASIQIDVSPTTLAPFRKKLLKRLRDINVKAVILDFSGLSVMDAGDFEEIKIIIATCELMGYPCVISNLNPGIISALITLNVDTTAIISFPDLDHAYTVLDER